MRTREAKTKPAPKKPLPTPQQLDEIRRHASAQLMLIADALRASPMIPELSMCMLDIEKVDLDAQTMHIKYVNSADGIIDRSEPINEPLSRILRSAIGTRVSGPVFLRADGSRFSPESLHTEWNRACRQAGFAPLQFRDSSLRFCVRAKTHPDNLTLSELAREAQVGRGSAGEWCELKPYRNGKKKRRRRHIYGHRSLGGFKGLRGGRRCYNCIRAEGWAIENGNIVPTYNRGQINTVLSSRLNDEATPPEEEGFVWVNRATAEDYGWTSDYLRHLAKNVVESKCLRPQGQPLQPKRLAASKEQLDAHYQRIKDAEDRQKGYLLPSEFCSATNQPKERVRGWIRDDFCSDLNRPLNLRRDADGRPERQEVFRADGVPLMVGRRAGELLFFVASLLGLATGAAEALVLLLIANRRKRFDSCYLIDEVESLSINAVNLVWIEVPALAGDLEMSPRLLRKYATKGRIAGADIKLSHANCRKFRAPGYGYVWRFHASVAIAYAEYRGRKDVAEKYRDQLQQKLDTGKKAKTAEQLADEALRHWKPDLDEQSAEPPAPPQPATPPAGGTGENGEEQGGNGATLPSIPGVASMAPSVAQVDPLGPDPFSIERAVIQVKYGDIHLQAPPHDADPVSGNQYVTLDQAAARVNRSKRTLEKRKKHKQDPLPAPDIKGGGGDPDEWLWANLKPWLERTFKRQLDGDFPDVHRC